MNKKMTYCFDLDGVVFTLVESLDYSMAKPVDSTIQLINRLYSEGHYIKLYTARGSATGIDWKDMTRQQLQDCGLKYHELQFGKPAADFYIDDRLISLEELHNQVNNR